jgi:hypothetical protein
MTFQFSDSTKNSYWASFRGGNTTGLSWFPSVTPIKFLDSTSTIPWPLPSKASSPHLLLYNRRTDRRVISCLVGLLQAYQELLLLWCYFKFSLTEASISEYVNIKCFVSSLISVLKLRSSSYEWKEVCVVGCITDRKWGYPVRYAWVCVLSDERRMYSQTFQFLLVEPLYL